MHSKSISRHLLFLLCFPYGPAAFDQLFDIVFIYSDVYYPAVFVCHFSLVYDFESKKNDIIRSLFFLICTVVCLVVL